MSEQVDGIAHAHPAGAGHGGVDAERQGVGRLHLAAGGGERLQRVEVGRAGVGVLRRDGAAADVSLRHDDRLAELDAAAEPAVLLVLVQAVDAEVHPKAAPVDLLAAGCPGQRAQGGRAQQTGPAAAHPVGRRAGRPHQPQAPPGEAGDRPTPGPVDHAHRDGHAPELRLQRAVERNLPVDRRAVGEPELEHVRLLVEARHQLLQCTEAFAVHQTAVLVDEEEGTVAGDAGLGQLALFELPQGKALDGRDRDPGDAAAAHALEDTRRMSRLRLTRQQILAFRRRVGGLDERLPQGVTSLRRAAWAGLQDSMPRAALLSLHARVEGVEPSTWEHPSLVQLWGPRYQVYVVPKRDFALFSVARLPEDERGGRRAEQMAEKARARLGGERITDRELGLGNEVRYAATTGTLAIRWGGARAPVVWAVGRPTIEPADARRELARRYLHVFGPGTADGFARWAGISRRSAAETFASLEPSLLPVRSPLGDEWLLAEDEPELRAAETPAASARLLPSGDAYFLFLRPEERALVVPEQDRRERLWTSRVWPGALLVEGELRGTWRRAQHVVRVEAWSRLSRTAREAVEAEAATLPLPGLERPVEVVWETPA